MPWACSSGQSGRLSLLHPQRPEIGKLFVQGHIRPTLLPGVYLPPQIGEDLRAPVGALFATLIERLCSLRKCQCIGLRRFSPPQFVAMCPDVGHSREVSRIAAVLLHGAFHGFGRELREVFGPILSQNLQLCWRPTCLRVMQRQIDQQLKREVLVVHVEPSLPVKAFSPCRRCPVPAAALR